VNTSSNDFTADDATPATLRSPALESVARPFEAASLAEPESAVRAVELVARDPEPLFCEDARLPDDLANAICHAAPLGTTSLSKVLLTGATGFLGAFLLRDLLVQTDAQVVCLVRPVPGEDGLARIRKALAKYGLWTPNLDGRVRVVTGDLEAERLGMSEQNYDALAGELDTIFHAAAAVDMVKPYAALKATNVEGALGILRLALHRKTKAVHHVSSLAVFGPAGRFTERRRVFENESLDVYVDGLRFDTGYAQSKWVAESLFVQARRRGARVTIHRPGSLMGDSYSGAGNSGDFGARLLKTCIQVGAYPDLPGLRRELTAVDYVSSAIVKIAGDAAFIGGTYHLVPARSEESMAHNDFFEMVSDAGYRLEKLSYDAWLDRLAGYAGIEALALDPHHAHLELHTHSPATDNSACQVALGESVTRQRRLDRILLSKYLGYFVRTGFLRQVVLRSLAAA